MPNHTATLLIVSGKSAKVKEFMAFCKGKKQLFSCEAILPMPPELHGISSPVKIVSDEEYEKAAKDAVTKKEPWGFVMPLTATLQMKYQAEYGADNWYDWACKNWGTKWDVYDCGEWVLKTSGQNSIATLFFSSAWSPITPVIDFCAHKFPMLDFRLKYADEGGGFLGFTDWTEGNNIGGTAYDWDSEPGKKLRVELYGNIEDEEVQFQCPVCSAEFASQKNLDKHFQNTHPSQWKAFKKIKVKA